MMRSGRGESDIDDEEWKRWRWYRWWGVERWRWWEHTFVIPVLVMGFLWKFLNIFQLDVSLLVIFDVPVHTNTQNLIRYCRPIPNQWKTHSQTQISFQAHLGYTSLSIADPFQGSVSQAHSKANSQKS